ncbi:actin-depolymerizing factor 3-like [Actinia tenebrosa]|uniref:Actin-depolymerizing factor 3-like n=1 Tax=Actinia tenebrosa TaxID=6105 RepID=A0A6P8HLX2_ACTTE|nr:actin-depolymerizing factor 3-like [Actinia tenebrosa]
MATSGVKCVPEVLDIFQKLSTKHVYRYITFKLNEDQTNIVVDKTGEPDKTFDDLKNDLPKDKCRYAVFDLKFFTKEQQQREKVIFISHSPDNHADGKEKMVYSSSKKALLDKLGSGAIHAKFHFGDHSDIDLDEITQEMRTKFK